ncbi:choice-of-anchor Q domain-containing protein [Larkinella punicea]|uniref:T9SS C-terminal target domain-containing protein n=1 Tax=Larkinella punicea TaxID=2315727 RepID=A0A368JL19_9BACT|nr:choice-of-anchor Q domain-containing protein [Larkinella punicea]RCR67253.1 T9SS C-terminal target domain-containing protein [Larkinella punicea]
MKKRFTSLFPTDPVGTLRTRFFLLGCLLGLSLVTSAQTTTRFVSTTGTNSNPATATSWATATSNLQGAINSLSAGGEVWVAGGTYKPTTGTDREIYFRMRNNVAIYGGFVGTEANRSERPAIDLTTPSSTTLSGDIGAARDPRDNSYHVIYNSNINSTAILDGFVITGGYADSDETNDSRGGGMYNSFSSPSLNNCIFIANSASVSGGGMYNSRSSPSLTNCSITSNIAISGGGVCNSGEGASPSFTNCSFVSNTARQFGGGMCRGENVYLTNCRFISNSASYLLGGGGVYNENEAHFFTNCSFASNTSATGGAISIRGGSSSLINCIFWDNDGNNTLSKSDGGTITASYCLFEPEVTGYTSSNNLTTTTSPFVSSDNLQLNNCSVAINAGDPTSATAVAGPYSVTALPQTDLAGNDRIYGNRVDMGAYELQGEWEGVSVSTRASTARVCIGQSVSLSATVTGGSNLSYSWAAPAGATLSSTTTNPVSATLLTSGPKAFTVTVTNLTSGCTATSNVTVTGNADPTATITPSSATLTCASPTVSLTASGGSSYRWDDNSTNAIRSVDAAGPYSVTVTSGGGCSASTSITVSENASAPTATITPSSATLTCASPTVSLTATGGVSYRWDDNSTNAIRTVSAAGPYSVTVTAENGCSASTSITVSGNSAAPMATITPSSATLTCASPTVSLTASGGTSYRWDDNSTNAIRTVSAAGPYSVTVTSGGGCSASTSITVSENASAPTPTITPSSATLTCASPTVSLTASGGTSYRWDDNSTNAIRTVSAAGPYSVTVTAENGCSASTSITVSENASAPTATITPSSATLTCASPTVSLTASGGTSYRWDDNSTNAIRTVSAAGPYSVTVTAGNGCSASTSVTVSGNSAAPTATITPSSATLTCASPTVSLTASGGTSYRWDDNSTNAIRTVSADGPYSVTVTAGNGCSASTNVTVSGNSAAPTATITPSSATLTCASPTVSLTASGGTSYRWDDNSTNAIRTVGAAGPYSVTVTAGNGCSASTSVTVSGNSAAPTATITPSSATLTCASPTVSLTASGGVSYRWDDNSTNAIRSVNAAGPYSVTVTAGNGCSASTSVTVSGNSAAPTATITPSSATLTCASPTVSLTATGGASYRWDDNSTNAIRTVSADGPYSVTVTAENGCSASTSVTVSGNSAAPTATITPSSATLTCASPTVSLTATGGVSYRWDDNSTNAIRTVSAAGPYSVTVTAGNGCSASTNVTVSGNSAAPTATITPSSATLTCASPTVSLTASGGTSYRWDDNSTNAIRTVSADGPYSVTVTAGNGCSASTNVTVSGNSAAPTATITPSSATLTCASPTVSLTASGGSSYRWDDNSTNAIRTVGAAGPYSVTVTAGNGCSASTSVTVSGNSAAPTATITPSSATLTCASPTVSLTASGGVSYRWDDNSTNAIRSVNAAGPYSVTVTAENGCSASTNVTVSGNSAAPTATITPSSATLTCASPTVSLTATGGVSYRWDDNSTNAIRTVSADGPYSVTVTAENGCSASTNVTVSGNSAAPTATITPSSATLTCASPTVSLTASGGVSYRWDDNSTNAIRTVSADGPYSVTVTAGNGCSASTNVTVSGNSAAPTATITPSSATLTCASPTVSLTASGGTSYRWDDNSTNAIRTVSAAGPYSVTVTSGNGCSASTSVTVSSNVLSVSTPNLTSTTVTQGAPTVSLTASNCAGILTWNGPGGSSGTGTISVLTTDPGTVVYQATCTVNGCISDPTSATVVVNAPTVTGSFDGFIYGADCSTFRGWVWDRNKPNTAVSVDILDGTNVIASLPADQFRQDLLDAGKGNGKHAFFWSIPETLKDGLAHVLSARVTGNSFVLKDSPKALICQVNTNPGGNQPPKAPTPTVSIVPLVAQVEVPFSAPLVAFTDPEGGTLSYGLSGLPAGLSLQMPNRIITGTPTESGIFFVTYQATDPLGASNSVSFQLTVNPAETVVTGSFEGYLDKLDCGGIRGWVWDRNKPNTPLTVEFYLEPSPGTITPLGSTLANIYRVDLKDAGKGNGAHAYNFTPPGSVANGTKVLARVLGSTFILKGSPKEYQCAPGSRLSAETTSDLQVTVLGNPVSSQVEVEIRGAEGKPLHVQLTDINGHLVSEQRVPQAAVVDHLRLPVFHQAPGMLLLQISTPTKQKIVKILKGK